MTTEQERLQQQRDQELTKIVNRRLLTKRINIKDYISEDNFNTLRGFLLHSFSTKTAVQYNITNADYAELFNVIYYGLPYSEISVNIYQLGMICKMLATGIDEKLNDIDEVYNLLLFKVETEPLNILFEKEQELIADASYTELKSNIKLESNGVQKGAGKTS